MNLTTPVELAPYDFAIRHSDVGLVLGSCFAEQLAHRLTSRKMRVTLNPMGISFNPCSLVQGVEALHVGRRFTQEDLHCCEGVWCSFDHHGSFSSVDPQEALERMNRAAEQGAQVLQQCDYVVITLGTAWVYELRATGRVVNNCHKFPASDFVRRRLGVNEIMAQLALLLAGCLREKRVIFTVSPIRHLKEGLVDNQLSKSTLLVALHELMECFPNACYFPAYEIMMDELRDYRFYERDLLHPAPLAVDYIWEKFCCCAVAPDTVTLFARLEKIESALVHRPINPQSDAHQKFRQNMLREVAQLALQYPALDLQYELKQFQDA